MSWFEDDPVWDEPPTPPGIEVEISDPQVLAYLYGPDGEPIATLLDRPVVRFGFVQ